MYCPSCTHLNLPGTDLCVKCLLDLTALDRPEPHDKVERSLMDDTVAILGPKKPVTVSANTLLSEAIRRMIDGGVGALLVTDANERLIGILTERDFLTKMPVNGTNGSVGDYMTRDPETVAATDPLAFALRKMDVGGYRHLPIVSASGVPEGMISVRDVLKHITKLCKE